MAFTLNRRPVGQRQHADHLRRCVGQCRQQAQRWQRNLIFLHEVRMHQPRQGSGEFADLAIGLRRLPQLIVQCFVLLLQGQWNLEVHDWAPVDHLTLRIGLNPGWSKHQFGQRVFMAG